MIDTLRVMQRDPDEKEAWLRTAGSIVERHAALEAPTECVGVLRRGMVGGTWLYDYEPSDGAHLTHPLFFLATPWMSRTLSLFEERVPNPRRGDYAAALTMFGFDPKCRLDPFEWLAKTHGVRMTDCIELWADDELLTDPLLLNGAEVNWNNATVDHEIAKRPRGLS